MKQSCQLINTNNNENVIPETLTVYQVLCTANVSLIGDHVDLTGEQARPYAIPAQ
jgi:hypothetical protein